MFRTGDEELDAIAESTRVVRRTVLCEFCSMYELRADPLLVFPSDKQGLNGQLRRSLTQLLVKTSRRKLMVSYSRWDGRGRPMCCRTHSSVGASHTQSPPASQDSYEQDGPPLGSGAFSVVVPVKHRVTGAGCVAGGDRGSALPGSRSVLFSHATPAVSLRPQANKSPRRSSRLGAPRWRRAGSQRCLPRRSLYRCEKRSGPAGNKLCFSSCIVHRAHHLLRLPPLIIAGGTPAPWWPVGVCASDTTPHLPSQKRVRAALAEAAAHNLLNHPAFVSMFEVYVEREGVCLVRPSARTPSRLTTPPPLPEGTPAAALPLNPAFCPRAPWCPQIMELCPGGTLLTHVQTAARAPSSQPTLYSLLPLPTPKTLSPLTPPPPPHHHQVDAKAARASRAQQIEGIYGALSEADARVVFSRLAGALAYLHDACQMVHRDVKLENVLVEKGGALDSVRLADFGFTVPVVSHKTKGVVESGLKARRKNESRALLTSVAAHALCRPSEARGSAFPSSQPAPPILPPPLFPGNPRVCLTGGSRGLSRARRRRLRRVAAPTSGHVQPRCDALHHAGRVPPLRRGVRVEGGGRAQRGAGAA